MLNTNTYYVLQLVHGNMLVIMQDVKHNAKPRTTTTKQAKEPLPQNMPKNHYYETSQRTTMR